MYAQLRNCIDMLVAAAFIAKHDLYGQAGVDLGALGDESKFPVETYNAPKQVATAVNSMWKGRRLMTPVGGGVEIRAGQALDDGEPHRATTAAWPRPTTRSTSSRCPPSQWWWD